MDFREKIKGSGTEFMFECERLERLEDFFTGFAARPSKGVYFYRINGYSEQIRRFLIRYYQEARRSGVVLEGRIPNPTGDGFSDESRIPLTVFAKMAAQNELAAETERGHVHL